MPTNDRPLTDEEKRFYSFMVSPAGGDVSFLIIPKADYRPQAAVWEQRGHFEIDIVKRSTAQQCSGKHWPLYQERLFNKVSFIDVVHFIDYVRLHDGWDSYASARAWAKRQMAEVRKYGSRAGFKENPTMAKHFYRTTYEIITPGDEDDDEPEVEQGWIDEEGESLEPDADDIANGLLDAVDMAIQMLDLNSANEPSEWGQRAAPRWWTNDEYDHDYGTGARESRSYHLEGFTEAERHAIYLSRMPQRGPGGWLR